MKVGIIGGSGLDDPKILHDAREKKIKTKYGLPSSVLTIGKIDKVTVVILARHGKNHGVPPTEVHYLANIFSLKKEGCDCILATTAVGSLKEEIKPGNLVFPNQFIDFTKRREQTFFKNKVVHTPMADPFSKKLRDTLCETSEELGFTYNRDVTVITIEGPRFSTRAESIMYQSWGADVVNMSTCPEVILANELGIPYQSIGMSTDYDCWKEDEEPVSFEMILDRMQKNADKVKELLYAVIPKLKCQ
ncbi:S-methyl-5'-thioadenosine phosphorylase [Candidatus Roizmanbacteria bacterium]|nr:S-methyl-5'-thioadenosine phosphorylase [Candidatus Roizmanbacteria bacterium]